MDLHREHNRKDELHNDYRNTTPALNEHLTWRALQPLAYNPQLLPFVDIDCFINRWNTVWLSAWISHDEVYVNGRLFPQMATPAVAEQVQIFGQLPYFVLMSSEREKAKRNMGPHGRTMPLCGPVSAAQSGLLVWLFSPNCPYPPPLCSVALPPRRRQTLRATDPFARSHNYIRSQKHENGITSMLDRF